MSIAEVSFDLREAPDEESTMAHTWKFFRAGGFDQVRLDSGDDLKALGELDPKLWVALACPVKGLELDRHTLELLDTDKDGRIRVPEVVDATRWVASVVKDANSLTRGDSELSLSVIDASKPAGQQLLNSAKQILKNLGKPDATTLTPLDTLDTAKIFAATLFNGDGVIIPESAEGDEALAQVVRDIIACCGSARDMSGKDGVGQKHIDQFFKEAEALMTWWAKADSDPALAPLKETTAAAHAARMVVKSKVDDYFARVGLATMDSRASTVMNAPEAELLALSTKELSASAAGLLALPLAKVEAGRALPLSQGLNPAWAAAVATFRQATLHPLLGDKTELTADDWEKVGRSFAAYDAWVATKPTGSVDKLGMARIKELTAGGYKDKVNALLARDKALEPEAKGIADIDRLVHYHRDLLRFLNNFVSFKDFYTKQAKAAFQAGTLYLDGRATDLVLDVADGAKHDSMAGMSMAYLAYCDCTRKGGSEKRTVVAAFTDGDSDFLTVGRNGVFYDRQGNDWDATVAKVVAQPISLREAFWSPYKRVGKAVSDQFEKFAATKRDLAVTDLQTGVTGAVKTVDEKKPPPPPTPFDVAKFAGIFAAIGIAIGAIGQMLVSVGTGLLHLSWWQIPLVVVGVMLLISGPAVMLAAMKLRQRNLAPLLDANGWAINARARINIPFGASLTHMATLPAHSQRTLVDPYADKKSSAKWVFLLLVLIATTLYFLHQAGFFEQWQLAIADALRPKLSPPDAGL